MARYASSMDGLVLVHNEIHTETKSKHLERCLTIRHVTSRHVTCGLILLSRGEARLGVFKCIWYHYALIVCSRTIYLMNCILKKQIEMNVVLYIESLRSTGLGP